MENERYHRQVILQGFGKDAQAKLLKAKVLVIGAGGLGCPALQYLAAAGIGTIGIADNDTIALSNLHRQILFTTSDIGNLKVNVAAKKLRAINPDIEIIEHPVRITKTNVLDILKSYDHVFDGSDNFETRYLINDACSLLKKPLIFSAVSGYEGQLAIFNVADANGKITNYRDLFPIAPKPNEIANCEENGVLGVLPGIIGTMAATETIKLISSTGKPLINTLLHYNLLTNEQYKFNVVSGNDYKLPETEKDLLEMNYNTSSEMETTFIEIDTNQLDVLRKQDSTMLVDVRERHEIPILDESIFHKIPMSTFAEFLENDLQEKSIILICQHGIRSVAAAEALHEKYGNTKNIYSLKGGIAKWRTYFMS